MSTTNGSAAVASLKVMPQSAVRGCVARCADRLSYVADLAAIAALNRPTHGARYLLAVVDELEADLVRLRGHVASAHPNSL